MAKSKNVTKEMFVDDDVVESKRSKNVKQPVDDNVSLQEPVSNLLSLPSLGKLGYPTEVPYRDILVKDEEILSMATEDTYAQVLNRVLKSILMDVPFYEKLSIHDRDYALIWLWANNYDPVKKMKVTCEHCGNVDTHSFDLRTVEVDDIKDNFVESIDVPLKSGTTIAVRMTRVDDELSASEYIKKHPNESYQYVILAHTIIVPRVMKFDDKLKWIRENMTVKEIGYVKNYHRYFKFGINTFADYTCTACGGVTRDFVPFQTEDILMPTSSDDFEQFLRTSEGAEDISD